MWLSGLFAYSDGKQKSYEVPTVRFCRFALRTQGIVLFVCLCRCVAMHQWPILFIPLSGVRQLLRMLVQMLSLCLAKAEPRFLHSYSTWAIRIEQRSNATSPKFEWLWNVWNGRDWKCFTLAYRLKCYEKCWVINTTMNSTAKRTLVLESNSTPNNIHANNAWLKQPRQQCINRLCGDVARNRVSDQTEV